MSVKTQLERFERELDSSEQLTQEQMTAILKGKEIADTIIEEVPDVASAIVNGYRAGKMQRQLAASLISTEDYGTTKKVAVWAVECVLKEFLPLDERERLATEHRSNAGKRLYEQGKGAFSLSPEEHREARLRGTLRRNEIHGPPHGTSYNKYSDITGMTENEYIHFLMVDMGDEFKVKRGSNKGKYNRIAIMNEVNLVYGNERTKSSINHFMTRKRSS